MGGGTQLLERRFRVGLRVVLWGVLRAGESALRYKLYIG